MLSPSTEAFERATKVPDYCRIDSVREIVRVDQEWPRVEVLRRTADGGWVSGGVDGREAVLCLQSIPLALPLGTNYRGLPAVDGNHR